MKVKTLIVFSLMFIFFSCGKNSNPISSSDHGTFVIKSNIDMSFSEISQTNYDSIIVYVKNHNDGFRNVTTSKVKDNGSFIVEIPKPTESELGKFNPLNYTSYYNDSTITITHIDSLIFPNEVKYARFSLGTTIYSNGPKGSLYFSSSIDKVNYIIDEGFADSGDSYFTYYYFNKATNITGFRKVIINKSYTTNVYIRNYNLQIEEGWNIFEIFYEGEKENITICKVMNEINKSGKWIYGREAYFPNYMLLF